MVDEITTIDDESFKPSVIAAVMQLGAFMVLLTAIIVSIFDKETPVR